MGRTGIVIYPFSKKVFTLYSYLMRPSLQLRLNQRLVMTPRLQQAIRLLQLSSQELELEIKTMLDTNPLLESLEESSSEIPLEIEEGEREGEVVFERGLDLTELSHPSFKKHDLLLQKTGEITLHQHLLLQMELTSFSERERTIAIALIDEITESGYLSSSLAEIQEGLNLKDLTLFEMEAVLYQIQQFDPIGIGARNLSECLSKQLEGLPRNTPWLKEARVLATHCLEPLGKRDYTRIKSTLKLTDTALQGAIKILTSLAPKPGYQHSPDKKSEYLIPDVLVRKKNGRFVVELNREFIPAIRVNPSYIDIIKCVGTNKGKTEMLREQLKEAKWFLKSLNTRHETLLRVAGYIIEQQKSFLEQGEVAMKPLNLQDIAKTVGLHASTISRITSHKYVFTPRGTFELKYFFSNAIASSVQHSATAIRAFIKKLIEKEPTTTPFSDHQITEQLLENGISIARRTVTKYRETMQIPSSNERKHSTGHRS